MDAPLPFPVPYSTDSLITVFTAALNTKQHKVAAFFAARSGAEWAAAYPECNTQAESFTLDWLKAQKEDGATRIETKFPISGDGPLGNPCHTLYFQIKGGLAHGVK